MIQFDPASFKDPSGRVFLHDGWICRTLSADACRAFESAHRAGLITQLIDDGLLVECELFPTIDLGLSRADVGDFILRQRRLPLVTYSYEWSFEMLRDAALTTLRILDRALAVGFVLKDANAFNILFDGNVPKLVDVPSIEAYRDGEVWAGYSQFCRSFLFPLLIASYRDLDIQAILRGTLGELPVQEAAKLLRGRDYLRSGVLKDVVLQARLERSFANSTASVKATASIHQYPKAMLVGSVRRLLKLIEGLKAPSSRTEWSAYDAFHSYSDADRATKASFVQRALAAPHLSRVVDLGCNTGEYSKVALRCGAYVIALDLDARAIDRLYTDLPRPTSLSPVVATLLNPTPAMGWALEERRSLLERIRSDGFLALALIHHLRITGGVPLAGIIAQLFAIAPEGVIEWVDKSDSMVARMLNLRPDVYADYDWPTFESTVNRVGSILSIQETHAGRRRLCHVRADSGSFAEHNTVPPTSDLHQ
jgi:hypothetical protein